jgi:predicted SnoaL-like aldol condensation-catalyzing enzyme
MVLPARAHVNSPRGTAGGGAKAGLLALGLEALAWHPKRRRISCVRRLFAVPAATPVLLAAPALGDSARQETNKRTVLELYEAGINQKDFAKASQYFGPRYTQHNPDAADGPEGFHKFVDFLREKFPNSRSEIKQVFADGDDVIPARPRRARARHARQRHRRHLQAREPQARRALGRDPADPGAGGKFERDVLDQNQANLPSLIG